MEMVVLIIHLLVCICLIGLVLLQRSEGGALGMGGGGGGSLMSGRGAADALAKMTSVAGGFFLVTSLGLTVLSGAAASSTGTSIFDSVPAQERTVTPPAAEPAAPAVTPEDGAARPDPTESSAPQSATTQLASTATGPVEATATPSTRAAPLGPSSAAAATPTRTATVQPARPTGGATVPASANTTAPRTTTPPPATTRSAPATTQASNTQAGRPALVLPDTSGSVTGINLSDDSASQTESIEIGGVEAVRRERAGPDQ